MKFRCSHCGRLHDPAKDSAFINSDGSLAHFTWYRDPKQNNRAIYATLCLSCGTLHGTSPSITKAIFTLGNRPLDVQFYMPIERLKQAISTAGGNLLPPGALELLIERGFLSGFENTTGKTFHFNSRDENLKDALNAAAIRFAIYCRQNQQSSISESTLRSYLLRAEQLATQDLQTMSSQNRTHIASARFFYELLADGAPVEMILDAARTKSNA